MGCSKIIAPRDVDYLRSHFQFVRLEQADVRGPIEEISRLTPLHLPALNAIFRQNVVEHRLRANDASFVRLTFKYL